MTEMLRAHEIHKSYRMGKAHLQVLCGVSLHVQQGEFVVIQGASGSGKSTLLHVLGALDLPDSGRVEFNGQSLFEMSDAGRRTYRNRHIGFVFQFYHLLPELNVVENVMMPRLVANSWWSWRSARRQARKDTQRLLERVGLADRAKHRPSELSGGERQRVAIARALINQPALLLADEPTGNLDSEVGGEILKLLAELHEAGQTTIMVTHDNDVASRADRRVQLSGGVIQEVPNVENERSPARIITKEVAP